MLCARVVRGISSTENEVTPVAGDFLDHFLRSQRPQESDQRLIAPHQRHVGLAGLVVRAVAQNLRDDVSRAETPPRDRGRTLPPFSVNAASGYPASPPAPASTTTSRPAFARFGITMGTSATRRSPGKLSLGTPTITKPLPRRVWCAPCASARPCSKRSILYIRANKSTSIQPWPRPIGGPLAPRAKT